MLPLTVMERPSVLSTTAKHTCATSDKSLKSVPAPARAPAPLLAMLTSAGWRSKGNGEECREEAQSLSIEQLAARLQDYIFTVVGAPFVLLWAHLILIREYIG